MQPVLTPSRFKQLVVQLHSSLWFVPAVCILGMMLLATGLTELDRHYGAALRQRWPSLFVLEAEGARSMLSTIATSMATIAGVVFSITMVALALVSNQYTSRVLRNYMRDRNNQVVLGIFIGIFLYCLLVLRAIGGPGGQFVPSGAVLGALLLAVLASGAFVFFVHHMSSTIQVSEIAQAITRETLQSIDKLFPKGQVEAQPGAHAVHGRRAWQPVPAQQWGYIQTVSEASLVAFARKHDVVVRMQSQPGDFVYLHQPILWLGMERVPDAEMMTELNGAYGISAFRTIDQDPAFGIRQLVDISLKALSPGVNDTTTAATCLEHIGVILTHCGRRQIAPWHHYDQGRVLRVLRAGPELAHLVAAGFGQVTESAAGNTEILLRILDTIAQVAAASDAAPVRVALREQAGVLGDIATHSARSQAARDRIDARLREVEKVLAAPAAQGGTAEDRTA